MEAGSERAYTERPGVGDWQGTEPAEGTRRATIYQALFRTHHPYSSARRCPTCLKFADAVESALLEATIDQEDEDESEGKADGFDYAKRCDELLDQREQARVGESTFKEQRDAALHLLRWLIGDLVPPLVPLRSEEDEEDDTDPAEPEEHDVGAPRVSGGRSGGKRAAMLAAIRGQAATEADAEAVVDELERTSRACMYNGRHVVPGEVVSVEGNPYGIGVSFLRWITGRG